MRIYKYPVVDNALSIDAPGASYICHAGPDPSGQLCIWALVEPGQHADAVLRVEVYGTGHEIPDDLDMAHLTSFVSGPFVWHVFGDIDYPELEARSGAA